MTKTLFPDQQQALTDAEKGWALGHQRILVVKPTGTGKTVVFTAQGRNYVCAGHRVLIIVDAEELVGQTVKMLKEEIPGISIGIVQASRNQAMAQVIVASKQTLDKIRRRRAIGKFGLIIIDEAHMAAAQGYIDIVNDLGGFDRSSGVKVIGYTATADRADDLALGDIWEYVAHNQPVEEAFRMNRLHRPEIIRLKGVPKDPDARVRATLAKVGTTQGAYFAGTVREAHQIRDAFRRAGATAEVIYDDIKKAERERIYDLTRRVENQVLVNVNVLVKGFDMPQLEWTAFGRKMQQVPYVQAGGRSLRMFDGSAYAPAKTGAKWIDFYDHQHDLQVQPNLAKSIEGKREKAIAAASARKESGPVRKPPAVSYEIHPRTPRFGRKHVRVLRIEKTGTYEVAKIYGHPMHQLLAMAKQAKLADQDRRAEIIREKIRAAGRLA